MKWNRAQCLLHLPIQSYNRFCFIKYKNNFLRSYLGVAMDTLKIFRFLKAINKIDVPNLALETLCSHFGIENKKAHDALEDIRANRSLIKHLVKCFDGFDLDDKTVDPSSMFLKKVLVDLVWLEDLFGEDQELTELTYSLRKYVSNKLSKENSNV